MTANYLEEMPNLEQWKEVIEKTRTEGRKAIIKMGLKEKGEALYVDKFKSWLEDESYWDGIRHPAKGSALYNDIRNALEFTAEIKPDPWRASFLTWLLEHTNIDSKNTFDLLLESAMRSPESFNYDRFRADFLESFGHALSADSQGNLSVHTSKMFNHENPSMVTYVTKNSEGQLVEVSQADIVKMMRDPKGPHVIHTANHAFMEWPDDLMDVKLVMDAYEKLYKEASKSTIAPIDKQGLTNEDSVLVFALNTRENKYLNLAQLFRRLADLDEVAGNPLADKFENASPMAINMVALLLKILVREEEVVRIAPYRDANGITRFVAPSHDSLHATPEGINALKRTVFEGYSKGGNDFRDAMRLLGHALESQNVNGGRCFVMPVGMCVRDFIQNIEPDVTGLNEKEMDTYYTDRGVCVRHFFNKNDSIAPFPDRLHRRSDPVIGFNGSSDYSGHTPSIAIDGVLEEPRSSVHFKAKYAALRQEPAAAISEILLSETADGKAINPLEIIARTPYNCTPALLNKALPAIREALDGQGLQHISLQVRERHSRTELVFSSDLSEPNLLSPTILKGLKNAFVVLGNQADTTLYVSPFIASEMLPAIKGAVVLSERSGLPLQAEDVQRSLEGLQRIDNRIGGIGEHSRIQRNVNNYDAKAAQQPKWAQRIKEAIMPEASTGILDR